MRIVYNPVPSLFWSLTPAVSRAKSRSEARAEAVGVGSSVMLGLDAPQTSVWGPPSVGPHQDRHSPPARAGLLAPRWLLGTPAHRRLHPPATPPDPHARVLTTEHSARARATCQALPWTAALAPDAVRTQDATLPRVQGQTGVVSHPGTPGAVAPLRRGNTGGQGPPRAMGGPGTSDGQCHGHGEAQAVRPHGVGHAPPCGSDVAPRPRPTTRVPGTMHTPHEDTA